MTRLTRCTSLMIFCLFGGGCHWLSPLFASSSAKRSVATCTVLPPSLACPYTITHRYIGLYAGAYYWFGVDAVPDAEAVGPAMCCVPAILQSVRGDDSVVVGVVGPNEAGDRCTIDFTTTTDSRDRPGLVMKRCHVPIPWTTPPAWLYTRQVPVDFGTLPADCEDITSSETIDQALSYKYYVGTPDSMSEMTGMP